MTDKKVKSQKRPPIVVILGHVDHGKTTLLDKIRKTNVQAKEAGGITQSIGASMITTKEGEKITFIDTPGHAAFSNMRSRGAATSDIAVLVVAADDGIMPQTKEALEYILNTDTPFIVAATKMDIQGVTSEKVKRGLENEGVLFEGAGGDVPLVEVSAPQEKGIDELLEMITLLAELNEISSDSIADFEGIVIETGKDKRGPLVSAVVKNGSLKNGDSLVAINSEIKVKMLYDYLGKNIVKAEPGEPVQILGFKDLPPVGSRLWTGEAKQEIQKKESKHELQKAQEGEIYAVIKAGSAGTLEAVLENLPEDVAVISSGVGGVTDSDVFLAKTVENPYIFSFGSNVPGSVKKLAATEGVNIRSYSIIYELLDEIDEIIKEGQTPIRGMAEIQASFPFNKKQVAGCKVVSGTLSKGDICILMQGDKEAGEVRISSVRRGKNEVNQVKAGEECGVIFEPQLDFSVGDMLISIQK